jgi:CRISPR-associated endonuclease Csn1
MPHTNRNRALKRVILPTPETPKKYRVGIDVGLYSVGLAAVEVGDTENPVDFPLLAPPKSILSCMSVIHDAGVDADSGTTQASRKMTAGIARRARRLRKQYRRRLHALDETLQELSYPLASLQNTERKYHVPGCKLHEKHCGAYAPWCARIVLVEGYVEDESARKELLSLAIRHIARHRGWRNAYQRAEKLAELANEPSKFYMEYLCSSYVIGKEDWQLEYHDVPVLVTKDSKDGTIKKGDQATDKETGELLWKSDPKNKTKRLKELHVPEDYLNARPTPAQLVGRFLNNTHQIRSHAHGKAEGSPALWKKWSDGGVTQEGVEVVAAQMGKLQQSDYYNELARIFEMQQVPKEHWHKLLEGYKDARFVRNGKRVKNVVGGVFSAVHPRDVGAAADLVAKDELPGQGRFYRATRASIAFQKYRVVSTVQNLRIGTKFNHRELSRQEIDWVLNGRKWEDSGVFNPGLLNATPEDQEEITWSYVAEELLGIERAELQGVGGAVMKRTGEKDADGKWIYEPTDESVSMKLPPVITTERLVIDADGAKKDLKAVVDWWKDASEVAKERFIESVQNAGRTKPMTEEERHADEEIDTLISEHLDEEGLTKLEKLGNSLASGRASYSVDSLLKLTNAMIEHNCDLHTARAICFFMSKELVDQGAAELYSAEVAEAFQKNNEWHPTPAALDEQTGSPQVDRTIKIVSRWLKACEKKWGKPETVNLEHVREGFSSVQAVNKLKGEQTMNYNRNVRAVKSALEGNDYGFTGSADAMRMGEIRRIQAIQRQNGQCAYCGTGITFTTCQMDHIVPQAGTGSSNVRENLVATCENCNLTKGKTPFAAWVNSQPFGLGDVTQRINKEWTRDSGMNAKDWKKYTAGVIANLKRTEDVEDTRSLESVAWMARELRERIEGRYGYQQADLIAKKRAGEEKLGQRVYVFRGEITAWARRMSGINGLLHWVGGADRKTRLDRRHHAVDAATIALMSPGVAQVLTQINDIKRKQLSTFIRLQDDITIEQTRADGTKYGKVIKSGAKVTIFSREIYDYAVGTSKKTRDGQEVPLYQPDEHEVFWKDFRGVDYDPNKAEYLQIKREDFMKWQTEVMNVNHGEEGLVALLNRGFDNPDPRNGGVIVVRQVRRKIANGNAHQDTVGRMQRKRIGDAWMLDELNRVGNLFWVGTKASGGVHRATSQEIWRALTEHEDYDEAEFLSYDKGKRQYPWKMRDGDIAIPASESRTLAIRDVLLDASDKIGVMKAKKDASGNLVAGLSQDGSPLPMRSGYVAQGSAIHHARFFKYPVLEGSGKNVGVQKVDAKTGEAKWQYGMLRVFKSDLLKPFGKKQDLFTCEILPESYSMRYCSQGLRYALEQGTAEHLGYMQVDDEVVIDVAKLLGGVDSENEEGENQTKSSAIQKFLKCFNEKITKHGHEYDITVKRFFMGGFNSDSSIKLFPIELAAEGIEELPDWKDKKKWVGEVIPSGEEAIYKWLPIAHMEKDEAMQEIGRIRDNFEKQFSGFVEWEDKDQLILTNESQGNINNILTVFHGTGGSWHPSIDKLLNAGIKVIRRTTLGEERWQQPESGNMPVSWEVVGSESTVDVDEGDESE